MSLFAKLHAHCEPLQLPFPEHHLISAFPSQHLNVLELLGRFKIEKMAPKKKTLFLEKEALLFRKRGASNLMIKEATFPL